MYASAHAGAIWWNPRPAADRATTTMDNLTHSLAGAVLAQMGLKHKTGLGMPMLIIGANLPDIDAWAAFLGPQQFAIRRGVTHGPLGIVLLPLLLTVAMLVFDRWRLRRPMNPGGLAPQPVHPGWLLALAYIGTLSHPLLDWMNSYGVRLLAPFSSTWYASNTLFIIDLWLWLAMTASVWMSIRRERRGHAAWRTPALACGAAIVAYIAANGLITQRAQALTHAHVQHIHARTPTLVVANPVPVMFWQRELLWRDATHHGEGDYSLLTAGDGVTMGRDARPHRMGDARVAQARDASADARAFLSWSRMPVASVDETGVTFGDQRFVREVTRATFTVKVPLPDAKAAPPSDSASAPR
jgi:inner membrane protein